MVYEIGVNRRQLEDVSEFKDLNFVLDESDACKIERCWKVIIGNKIAITLRLLVNARGL